MGNNIKKAKITSIIIVCIALILMLILIFQFLHLNSLQKKNEKLNNTLANLEEVISDYSKQKDYYEDREKYLDEYAHEVLNMSKDDETWYVVSKN